mgnify:CR=1 FL=1
MLKTGKILYEQRIDRADQVYASAIIAGDKIYYLERNGKTRVVRASPTFELLATNDLGERSRCDPSPAILGERLLIRSQSTLYCIGK